MNQPPGTSKPIHSVGVVSEHIGDRRRSKVFLLFPFCFLPGISAEHVEGVRSLADGFALLYDPLRVG